MLPVLIPMFVFTCLVLMLAGAVLGARRRLAPEMEVPITVNGQRALMASTGDKLLWQLAKHGIYLPAACGGRGACGQCKVQVTSGGGRILPTEMTHLNRREIQQGLRLACAVTVRQALAVRLPKDVLQARNWSARVRSNRHLSTFLRELVLELPEPMEFEAGDYVLLTAPVGDFAFADFAIDSEYEPEWRRLGLFDLVAHIDEPVLRAYSLANPPAAATTVRLVVRIATPPAHAPPDTPPGMVSSYVFSLKPGDPVELSGPFGEFHAQDSTREMVLIGGGAGIAPLHSMVLDQLESKRSNRPISFWYGARNLRELCYRDEFEALARSHPNFRYEVALSQPEPADQWHGATGLIHTIAFEKYLHDHPQPEEVEYYLCGPPLMTAAIRAMLEDLGVEPEFIFLDDFGG